MYTYEKTDNGITVTGFDGTVNFLNVPEAIDGVPVTAIAPKAFAARSDVTEIALPGSITTLGGFAFHNCVNLKRITLHNTVTNYSDGVVKGCRAVEEVCVIADAPDEAASYEVVKRMLADTDVVLRFKFVYVVGEAVLIFPDYLADAREDTRARAIHQTIEGAGYAYRECVSRKGIDYAGYDALFDRVRQIAPVTAEDIAMNRLMTPYRLYEKSRAQYERFLRERSKELLLRLIRLKDTERIRFLTEAHLLDAAVIDDCLDAAAGQAEVVALLIRYR